MSAPRPVAVPAERPLEGEPRRQAVQPAASGQQLSTRYSAPISGLLKLRRSFSLKAISFFIVVMLPTFFAAIYYFGIASNQYISESRFGVRNGEMYRSDTGGSANSAGNILAAGIDSHVIVQFIHSSEIVSAVQKKLNILAMFSRDGVDYLSRSAKEASIEDLTAYWRSKVEAFFDTTTGTISLRVRAFTPQDALLISQEVLRLSEDLVNEMSTRARGDSLRIAEGEVRNAEERLQTAREALLSLRNEQGILDPRNESQAQLTILTTLRAQIVRARGELADMLNYLDANAVQIRTTRNRIRSLEEQLAQAEAQRTSASGAQRGDVMSQSMAKFERLDTERMFAERNYNLVLEDLQKARVNASRQLVYLATFVKPIMADRSVYPKRLQNTAIVLMSAFFAWVLTLVMIQSVREHA